MGLRIGIGGPPQSGKSVFNSVLFAMLPASRVAKIEGAPDGEGIGWAHYADQALVKAIRVKGSFYAQDESGETVDFCEEVSRRVRGSSAPITLVDVGGMMSDDAGKLAKDGQRLTPENEKILRACSHFVVISSKPDLTQNWLREAERLGLETLAILDSQLEGQDEVFSADPLKGPIRARVTRLEREAPPFGSPAVRAVANRILELAGNGPADGSEKADVNFSALSQSLDLPLQNSGPNRDWVPSCLPELVSRVSSALADRTEARLWGFCSAGFPYHALACGLEQRVRFWDYSLNNYIPLPELRPQGQGNHFLNWRVEERDSHTLMEFSIPGQIFDVFDLPMVIPPAVSVNKGVVLSGRGPWWLIGTLLRAYTRAGVSWTAAFTPGESGRRGDDGRTWSENHPNMGPAVVVASRDESVTIGTVLPFQLPK